MCVCVQSMEETQGCVSVYSLWRKIRDVCLCTVDGGKSGMCVCV